MIDSRAMYDLESAVSKRAGKFIDGCKGEGIILLITSTSATTTTGALVDANYTFTVGRN